MERTDVIIANFVAQEIRKLSNSPVALAKLRRGVGKEIGDLPELLEYVLLPNEVSDLMAEQSVYTALTLYALHQQGKERFMGACEVVETPEGYSKWQVSFGASIKKLITKDNEVAIKRRFDKVLTARDLTELAVHARGLIGLLKKADITVNYAGFAKDLYWFQQVEYRRNVILKWGKDYYTSKGKEV